MVTHVDGYVLSGGLAYAGCLEGEGLLRGDLLYFEHVACGAVG